MRCRVLWRATPGKKCGQSEGGGLGNGWPEGCWPSEEGVTKGVVPANFGRSDARDGRPRHPEVQLPAQDFPAHRLPQRSQVASRSATGAGSLLTVGQRGGMLRFGGAGGFGCGRGFLCGPDPPQKETQEHPLALGGGFTHFPSAYVPASSSVLKRVQVIADLFIELSSKKFQIRLGRGNVTECI